jgi:hypothetical protein
MSRKCFLCGLVCVVVYQPSGLYQATHAATRLVSFGGCSASNSDTRCSMAAIAASSGSGSIVATGKDLSVISRCFGAPLPAAMDWPQRQRSYWFSLHLNGYIMGGGLYLTGHLR